MKKSIVILSVLALMLVFALPVMAMGLAEDMQKAGILLPGAAAPAEAKPESLLEDAAEFVKANYDKSSKANPAPRTTADFEVYDQITIKGQVFDIEWSTDTQYVTADKKDNHVVLINIAEDAPEETVYNLIAVVKDSLGKQVVLNMPKTLPQGSTDPSLEEIVLAAYQLADGEYLPKAVRLAGFIVDIPTAYSEQYGNITVNLAIGDKIVQAYRLTGGADLKVGDAITVVGNIKNYKGTIEFDKGCRYVGAEYYRSVKTLLKAYELEDGKALEGTRMVKGTIVAIPSAYSEQYGNITVNIQVGGLDDLIIQCYRLTGGADLAIGDEITVKGIIKNYKGTIEFDKNCVYTK